MNINKKSLNIESHFIKNGYYIFDANKEGLNSIKSLRKKILNYTLKKYPKIKEKFKNESLVFEKMHSFIPKKSLNEFRLQIVDMINNDKNCSDNYYLAAKEGLDLLTKGKYGGVGINLGEREKKLTVISPIDDSPAKEKGIIAGDVIV